MLPSVTILEGDVLDRLADLPDESVQCCVTSPPYWGLRDYGVKGQLGLEKTPDLYIRKMVTVFDEVRRVLKKDGSCWVNMGDSYCSTNKWGGGKSGTTGKHTVAENGAVPSWAVRSKRDHIAGIKPKDLMGMPWRLAFALQAAGWYLRCDIIWSKPNPMPESVTDRPTKSHEYIFLLSKSPHYFYDAAVIREAVSPNTHARLSQNVEAQIGSARANGGAKTNGNMKAVARKGAKMPGANSRINVQRTGGAPQVRDNENYSSAVCCLVSDRNKRSVWTVPTHSFKGAHFATFPPDLIKPCILAGCMGGGTVLDPFGGSGTTGMVALELGRNAILIELNPDYAAMARRRCLVTPGLNLETA